MVRERSRAFRGIAQIQQHQHVLVLRQAELRRQLLRIEEVDPAAVDALGGRGEEQMRRDDARVLRAGVPLAAGIGEDALPVEGDGEDRARAVTAGRDAVDLLRPSSDCTT